MRTIGRVALPLLLLGPWTPAQVMPGVFGYEVVSSISGAHGEFCFGFDCTPRAMQVVAGERLTLTVRAPMGAFYGIGIAGGASSCLPIPGFQNSLILDFPVFTVSLGIVSQPSPVLSCWSGVESMPFQVPRTLPRGFVFSTQAVADIPSPAGGTAPGFSVAVTATVR